MTHIDRDAYQGHIHTAIHKEHKKLILINGSRGSGKTTILQEIRNTQHKKICHYFSFDDDIVAKKFSNLDDFISYMQIKYGIDFHDDALLLLNEIQYSKNIFPILREYIQHPSYQTTIVATGIAYIQSDDYQSLVKEAKVSTITVRPLAFFDLLDSKGVHTHYLQLDNSSSIVFKEVQRSFDEYLTRGGYPAVITSTTAQQKQQAIKAIIQKVYDKDIGFCFYGDEILLFQDIMTLCCRHIMQGYKIKRICKELSITASLLKKYTQFLINNNLIATIPYFFTDKERELSHQEYIVITDMGIVSYMMDNYGSKLYDMTTVKNFIYTELSKYIAPDDRIMTYKKINNSQIDFIIVHSDETITPIVVSETNTTSFPKVYKNFFKQYKNRIRIYIKTTPLTLCQKSHLDKTFRCIPHFMIKFLLTIKK